MTTTFDPQQLIGKTAVDSSGDKIGKIGQVYLDDRTGEPAWLTVSTGLFGSNESFAPVAGVEPGAGEEVRLSVSKAQVKDAPNIADDGHIGDAEQEELYRYYGQFGVGGGQVAASADTTTAAGTVSAGSGVEPGGPGHDVSGPNTDEAMTRSEEQLRVGTQSVESGRARLRKYVVTENVTQTVPVSHEEVRIEREPITEANVAAASAGPAISEEEHEITLHAEQPVVQKQAVPVERVRMDTQTVTEQAQINEDIRKEQIDIDSDGTTRS